MDKHTKTNSEIIETPSSDRNDKATDKFLPASETTALLTVVPVKSCLLREKKDRRNHGNNVRFSTSVEVQLYFPESIGKPFIPLQKRIRRTGFLQRNTRMASIRYQFVREYRVRRVIEVNAREHSRGKDFTNLNEIEKVRLCREFIRRRDRRVSKRLGLTVSPSTHRSSVDTNEVSASGLGDFVEDAASTDGAVDTESTDGTKGTSTATDGTKGRGSAVQVEGTGSTKSAQDKALANSTEGIEGSTEDTEVKGSTGSAHDKASTYGAPCCTPATATDSAENTTVTWTDEVWPKGSMDAGSPVDAEGNQNGSTGGAKGNIAACTRCKCGTRCISKATESDEYTLPTYEQNRYTDGGQRKWPSKSIKSRLIRALTSPFRKIGRSCLNCFRSSRSYDISDF